MRSVLIKAAQAILSRGSRERFTQLERDELSLTVNAIERKLVTPLACAQRGEVVIGLLDIGGTFEEGTAAAMADIMHAAKMRGLDPLKVLALASARYAREAGLDD